MDLLPDKGIASSIGRGTHMTQNKSKKKSSNSLIKKLGLIIIGLFLLYVIAGFWAAATAQTQARKRIVRSNRPQSDH
jgi:hypothetical protein